MTKIVHMNILITDLTLKTNIALFNTPWNVGISAKATETPRMESATRFIHKALWKNPELSKAWKKVGITFVFQEYKELALKVANLSWR